MTLGLLDVDHVKLVLARVSEHPVAESALRVRTAAVLLRNEGVYLDFSLADERFVLKPGFCGQVINLLVLRVVLVVALSDRGFVNLAGLFQFKNVGCAVGAVNDQNLVSVCEVAGHACELNIGNKSGGITSEQRISESYSFLVTKILTLFCG